MTSTLARRSRTMVGVSVANAVTLCYGLVRPDSLAFSIPFLVVPSLILLWSQMRGAGHAERVRALWVTAGVVAFAVLALAAAVLI